MFKISNFRKGIYTSIIGALFLLVALIYFIYPMVEPTFVVDTFRLIAGAGVGVGLLLSPDDLFKSIKDKLIK